MRLYLPQGMPGDAIISLQPRFSRPAMVFSSDAAESRPPLSAKLAPPLRLLLFDTFSRVGGCEDGASRRLREGCPSSMLFRSQKMPELQMGKLWLSK